jgi:hypothetical protein
MLLLLLLLSPILVLLLDATAMLGPSSRQRQPLLLLPVAALQMT